MLDLRPIYNEDEIESYLNYKYRFRYNIVLGKTELFKDKKWVFLQDFELNSLYREISKRGGKIAISKLHSLLESDFVKQYHPMRDYFNDLKP